MLLLAVVALMAAMVVASAMPAFAKVKCEGDVFGEGQTCRGGESFSEPGGINNGLVGGQGGLRFVKCDPERSTAPRSAPVEVGLTLDSNQP